MFSSSIALVVMFFSSVALAAPAGGPAKPSLFESFLPFIFIIAIFYLLIMRPQSKRTQAHQTFVKGLKRGDSVLTSGGIMGTIEGLTDKFVTLEIADDVRIRVLRSQIAGPAVQEEAKS